MAVAVHAVSCSPVTTAPAAVRFSSTSRAELSDSVAATAACGHGARTLGQESSGAHAVPVLSPDCGGMCGHCAYSMVLTRSQCLFHPGPDCDLDPCWELRLAVGQTMP